MKRRLWHVLPWMALLLCLLLASSASAKEVVSEGVRYFMDEEGGYAIILSYEDGAERAVLYPAFQGLPVLAPDEYDPANFAASTLAFAGEIDSIEPYLPLLNAPTVQHIEFLDSFPAFDQEQYWLSSWLHQVPLLESISLPASADISDVLYIVGVARDLYDYSVYDLRDSIAFGEPYDANARRSFTHILIDDAHPALYDIDGVLFDKETDALLAFLPARGGAYSVPSGTTAIADRAFYRCDQLQSISLPPSVRSIGERAFALCADLHLVQLSPTLQSIGARAFNNCVSLPSIIIPEGAQVGESAFSYCISLKSAYILGDAAPIAASAFRTCHSDLVLYAKAGSPGAVAAASNDVLWAEVDGPPQRLPNPTHLHANPAIVHSDSSTNPLPLYAQADAGDIAAHIPIGTTVDVLQIEDGWAHIALYQAEGYMPLDQLRLQSETGEVQRVLSVDLRMISDPLLYKVPSEQSPFATKPERDSYSVIQRYGTWYVVETEDGPRYLPAHQAQPNAMNLVAQTVGLLNDGNEHKQVFLYREPSEESEPLGIYYEGTQVVILESPYGEAHPGFYLIAVDGQEGYVDQRDMVAMWDVYYSYAW